MNVLAFHTYQISISVAGTEVGTSRSAAQRHSYWATVTAHGTFQLVAPCCCVAKEAKPKTEPSVEAAMLLFQGKRHLIVQDYTSAVVSLQEACELLAKLYGETGKECGEAYLCYGRALLELARQESDVLGDALESEEEKDDDEDDDDEEEDGEDKSREEDSAGSSKEGSDEESEKKQEQQSGSAADEKKQEQSGSAAEPSEIPGVAKAVESKDTVGSGDGEAVAGAAPEVKAQQNGGENEEDAEEDLEKPEPALKEDTEPPPSEPGTSTAGPSGSSSPPKEEDVPNLQLAWEVLELAKNIFKRQAEEETENNRDYRLKVAEVLLRLGEISLESDNCEQAVEDFSECLSIQRELLEPDDRKIAETYYQRGLAYSFGGLYQQAFVDFTDSVRVLELRVENRTRFVNENKDKEREGSLEDDPVWVAEREVEDLKKVLPEVRNRVEDTEDTIRQDCRALKDATIQKMRERLPATSPVKSSDSGPESSRPVNVITHLIKRKPDALQRTSDEGGSAGSSAATPKKIKPEAVDTNGESSSKPLASEIPKANDCEKPATSPLKSVAS
ncbi:protein HGV2-like isoform X3 [Dermacentor variabilis]|uniref:protein HGV2-like isoform X3 n=1 Tax=Dermacentor variabilis TaxID=34621 RepID=UPI003F5BD2EA